MTEKEKALAKIRKCLALSGSSNPHEAAAALRQAEALMRKYEVDEMDVAMSEITEASAKASGSSALPLWEHMLATCVASTCGCKAMFVHGPCVGRQYVSGRKSDFLRKTYGKGDIVFVGRKERAALAGYSFETLRRQLRKARKDFGNTYKVTPAQLDAFATGWVNEVASKVRDLVAPLADAEMIESYLRRKNGDREVKEAKCRDKSGITTKKRARGIAAAFLHGEKKASDAQLHAGIGADAPLQIGVQESFNLV